MRFDRSGKEDAILIAMMFFAPMAFAGVHIWAYSLIALGALVMFDMRFLGAESFDVSISRDKTVSVFKRPESKAILIFTALCVMYMVPLPRGVVKLLSPLLVELRDGGMFSGASWQTLSAYPRATLSYIIKLVSFLLVYFVVMSKITSPQPRRQGSLPRSVYPAFIVFGALMGVLSILFHSFVDFNLQIPANALYFTILLTIIAAVNFRGGEINYAFLGKLVNSVIVIGFIVGLFGIIQWLGWDGRMFWLVEKPGANFGPFVCYNNFAGFMEMTAFMSIALFYSGVFTSPIRHMKKFKDKVIWFSSPEANQTVLYLFASIVMVGALFLSRSRGGIISFALSFLVFVFVCVGISPRTRKAKLSILAFVVLGLFTAMIMWLGPQATIVRFQQLPVMFRHLIEGRESFHLLRPLMWIDTVKIIGHFPFVGAGFGAYSNIFIIERTFSAGWGFLVYAHQDYLHLLAEMGAIGAAYLALFLVWYVRRFRGCIRRLRISAENLEKY